MEPVVGPRQRAHHDLDGQGHDHPHQGGRQRQLLSKSVGEPAGRGSVEGPSGCTRPRSATGSGSPSPAHWVLQNPVFNGYEGIAAYETTQKISIVIDNTHGPTATPGSSIATEIFKALTAYLTPNDPI